MSLSPKPMDAATFAAFKKNYLAEIAMIEERAKSLLQSATDHAALDANAHKGTIRSLKARAVQTAAMATEMKAMLAAEEAKQEPEKGNFGRDEQPFREPQGPEPAEGDLQDGPVTEAADIPAPATAGSDAGSKPADAGGGR